MTDEYKEYLSSKKWKCYSEIKKNLAGNKCQVCSSKNNLNVHHNTYKNIFHENLEDLIVLCRRCHELFHNKKKKKKYKKKNVNKKNLKKSLKEKLKKKEYLINYGHKMIRIK